MTRIVRSEDSNIYYYIDENRGTVVAAVNRKDIIEEVFCCLVKHNIPIYDKIYHKLYEEIEPFTYKAVAICSEKDEFDEEVGKKYARNRVLKKYYKARLAIFEKIADELSRQIDYIEDQMNYSWTSYNRYSEQNQKVLDSQKRD